MEGRVRCPLCGYDVEDKPLKMWKFRFYDVKRFKCPNCGARFNLYESSSSKFTIPKTKTKI